MHDYNGVLTELLSGKWQDPHTGEAVSVSVRDITIKADLHGLETQLLADHHHGQKLFVVSDPNTHAVLGERVYKSLQADGFNVQEYVWTEPECSDAGVEHIRHVTRHCDARVAVGSGTISDTVKYACFLDKCPYSVFATSPMNAYSSSTASVLFDGFKRSIGCNGPQAIFFDLDVVANCPSNLISAAFADVICRTTSQVDWLLSHLLTGTPYTETPFALLAHDEQAMIANASKMLSGDIDAIAMLTRVSVLMGLGSQLTGSTHSGSMAEHMISHYIDMFAGHRHPQSSHGEQVGIATVSMSHLHNLILGSTVAPVIKPTSIPQLQLQQRFSDDMVAHMTQQTTGKALDRSAASRINELLQSQWESVRSQLTACMLSTDELIQAMRAAGCPLTASDLHLDADFYKEAVRYARFIRDRFTMLDVSDDSDALDSFISSMPV